VRFTTSDPRIGGLGDRVGAVTGYVTGGALYTLIKVGTGDTDWASVPALLPPAPMESSRCPFVSTDPRTGGRAAQVNEVVGYYTGGAVEYLIKYSSGDTDWVQLPDTTGPGGGGIVADGDKGDITVSGGGVTWTIDNNVVSNAKLRDSSALSVIGRSANSVGDPADITASSDGDILRRSGTTLGFGNANYAHVDGLTAGSVVFAGASGQLQQDNAAFYFDDVNNRWGFGINSLSRTFEIQTSDPSTHTARICNTSALGFSALNFDKYDVSKSMGIGYSNPEDIGYLSIPTTNLKLTTTGNITRMTWFSTTGNVNIGATSTDPSVLLRVEGQLKVHANVASDAMFMRNSDTAGLAAIQFQDNTGGFQASLGYSNASNPTAWVAGLPFFYSGGSDWVFAQGVRNHLRFGMANDSAFIEVAKGDSAAVSNANTGRIRYNVASQRFELSHNTAAYVNLTTGSGTTNTLPKWTSTTGALGDSAISDSGTTVSFGGRKLTDTYTGTGSLAALSMTGTGLTVAGIVTDYSSSATYDTTAGALSAIGTQMIMFGSKSAGGVLGFWCRRQHRAAHQLRRQLPQPHHRVQYGHRVHVGLCAAGETGGNQLDHHAERLVVYSGRHWRHGEHLSR
jgi:hypothetical protein